MLSTQASTGQWGRAWEIHGFTFFSTLLIIISTPLIVVYFYLASTFFNGSLAGPLVLFSSQSSLWEALPTFEFHALLIYATWFTLQIILAVYVPDMLHRWIPKYEGGIQYGSITPAGN